MLFDVARGTIDTSAGTDPLIQLCGQYYDQLYRLFYIHFIHGFLRILNWVIEAGNSF